MRWVVEQRPDIIEGYLSGMALLRGAGPDEIIGTRRRKMTLETVSSSRFQREYVFVRNAPYDRMDRASFCAAISGRPIHGATRSTACQSPRPPSRRLRAGEIHLYFPSTTNNVDSVFNIRYVYTRPSSIH
jgi:hypothetical protein